MALERNAEFPVDRACGNRQVVAPVAFPEQHRAAFLAEGPPPRLARAVPFESARFAEPEMLILHRRRRHVGACLLAALMAMTGDHRAERSGDLECDGPAEARSGLVSHGLDPSSLLWRAPRHVRVRVPQPPRLIRCRAGWQRCGPVPRSRTGVRLDCDLPYSAPNPAQRRRRASQRANPSLQFCDAPGKRSS